MEISEKLIHPFYSNIQLHFLPHLRAYNVTTQSYCNISEKNLINISYQFNKNINFDKFKLECKMGRRLGKNEVVDYKCM